MDEDDDAPGFPMLMAIPAVVWVAHTVFVSAVIIHGFCQPPDEFMGHLFETCLSAILTPIAILQLFGVRAILTRRGPLIPGVVATAILSSGYLLIGFYGRQNTMIVAFSIAAPLIGSCIIMYLQWPAWTRWRAFKNSSLNPDSNSQTGN